jgi:hypothetical protein
MKIKKKKPKLKAKQDKQLEVMPAEYSKTPAIKKVGLAETLKKLKK